MFRRFFALVLFIILVAGVAFADQRIVGHMTPLPEEKLENPVTLDCGIIVQEVHGSMNYARLNAMCTHAYENFWTFVDAKGLETRHRNRFAWNISFLPDDTCYRCLNDEQYRFKFRHVHGRLIGYTDRDQQYAFMISNHRDREFNVTFVHELFHSMSMYYGVYDNHGGTYAQKTAADERLAVEFTEWLGYGR
jgi:hypothetical protein